MCLHFISYWEKSLFFIVFQATELKIIVTGCDNRLNMLSCVIISILLLPLFRLHYKGWPLNQSWAQAMWSAPFPIITSYLLEDCLSQQKETDMLRKLAFSNSEYTCPYIRVQYFFKSFWSSSKKSLLAEMSLFKKVQWLSCYEHFTFFCNFPDFI